MCLSWISNWMLHTGGGWGETPHMIVKRFGCMTIHNKALYKCLIHAFKRFWDMIAIWTISFPVLRWGEAGRGGVFREGAPYQRRGSLQLWQFLVALLDDPGNAHFIAWTGRGMEFKLIEPEEVKIGGLRALRRQNMFLYPENINSNWSFKELRWQYYWEVQINSKQCLFSLHKL